MVSDNDDYSLRKKDGYYTNGIYFKVNYVADLSKNKWQKKINIKKVVNSFEAGQAIYHPYSYKLTEPLKQDRPFAGYLALSFDKQVFYNTNSVLQLAISLGTIGPNSFAEDVQRLYHDIIDIYAVRGWPYQLKNELNLNIKGGFVKSFLKGDKTKRVLNIDGFAKAEFGNAFSNAGIGGLFRLGRTENNWNSAQWRARVSNIESAAPVNPFELYFFYQPSITFQAHNATIQGGMFINDKGPVTAGIRSLVISNQWGIRFSRKRWTTAIVYTFKSKEAKKQIASERLGSVQIAYRFKKLK